jgi:hypothetical protein
MSQTPTVGRIITVVGGVARSNGTDVAPAIVTRAWGQREDGAWTINARVFPDAGIEQNATSIVLWPDEDAARATLEGQPLTVHAAFWPARA